MVDGARRVSRVPEIVDPKRGETDHARIQQWETAFWLRTHLRALPTDQQEVVRQRFFEDCSFRDIAQRMGRSEPAVKQLLRRALRALHAQIQEEAPVDGE
jgi:RNA polymerase sigma factor (sigma-70 family)